MQMCFRCRLKILPADKPAIAQLDSWPFSGTTPGAQRLARYLQPGGDVLDGQEFVHDPHSLPFIMATS
jgi:hypothetical protein